MSDVLPVLHHALCLAIQTRNDLDVGVYLCALFDLNSHDDKQVQRCLQILHQVLKTVSEHDAQNLNIGDEIFHRLIDILLDKKSSYNNMNVLACLKLYIGKLNAGQIITKLWSLIKDSLSTAQFIEHTAALQTLVQFFDEFSRHISDFKQSLDIDVLVQHLLNSARPEDRKCAYFLLKKDHTQPAVQPAMRLSGTQSQEARRKANFWSICISCFENLEENEFRLILPMLEQLKNLRISDLREQIWLDVLYRQILRHNNIYVRRWIVEYMLGKLTFFSITKETQLQFMRALNDNSLYNIEGYMLPEQNIVRFLVCEKSSFLLTLSQIDWQAVPLHFWLSQLITHWQVIHMVDITRRALLNFAKKIQTLRKVVLRRENIKLFEKLFFSIIRDMDLVDYVELIEALYNETDYFENVPMLTEKLKLYHEEGFDGNSIFSKRFCNILTNRKHLQRCGISNAFFDFVRAAIAKIKEEDWTLGYLRFVFLYYLDVPDIKLFFQTYYGIDATTSLHQMHPKAIYEMFEQRLALTDVERILLKQRVTDFFTHNLIDSFAELRKYNISLEELLNGGSYVTLCSLSEMLTEHKEPVGRVILDCFIEQLRKNLKNDLVCQFVAENLMKYCWKNLERPEVVHWGTILINLDLENMKLCNAVTSYVDGPLFPDDFLIKCSLLGDTKIGDSRIAEAYECKVLKNLTSPYFIRMKYIHHIDKISDKERRAGLLQTLCKMLRYMNLQKPKYDANGVEHRMLIRILCVIFAIIRDTKMNSSAALTDLWAFLMEHDNQENVTILCEIAITTIMKWEDLLAKVQEQLMAEECNAHQELSMVALLFRSFKLKGDFSNPTELEKVLLLLWSLRVSPDDQVRLKAQHTISALLDGSQKDNTKSRKKQCILEQFVKLDCALKRPGNSTEIIRFRRDIRFMELKIEDAFENVMAFTNVPYDEYNFVGYPPLKTEALKTENNRYSRVLNGSIIERKSFCSIDFMPSAKLAAYPDSEQDTLCVVGCLIDKVSVLEAVAHTCHALGIKNLIVDSKLHTKKADFEAFSSAAEKILKLKDIQLEELPQFILQKKAEGYKIVAAKRTTNSCSFNDFSFPNRSVILLGHEKEGIPANLLGHLDYAVNISHSMKQPCDNQAANTLLLYEYCKQRLLK